MDTKFRESKFIDFNKGQVFIAPMELARQTPRPWSLPHKVELFECMVDVWQLGVAVEILKEIERHQPPSIWSHSAYGLIAVIFTYFEMIGKSLNPESKRTKTASRDFNYGFCDVYPEYMPVTGVLRDAKIPQVKQFRDRVRNGKYHLAATKTDLVIHNDPKVSKDFMVGQKSRGADRRYYMNPHRVTRTIVRHFPSFIARLRNAKPEFDGLRGKFLEFFDEFHQA